MNAIKEQKLFCDQYVSSKVNMWIIEKAGVMFLKIIR
jgi:hypothetical protein